MLCGPNLELVYASESLTVACMCDLDYRTCMEQGIAVGNRRKVQKRIGILLVCREGFIYRPHVSAQDVRTVCHKVEKSVASYRPSSRVITWFWLEAPTLFPDNGQFGSDCRVRGLCFIR